MMTRIWGRDPIGRHIVLAYGLSHGAYDRSIDVQVSHLRHKLKEGPKDPMVIRTVRNGDYIFTRSVRRG